MYIAYLDEFGHIGPYVSSYDPSYKTHPVFGLGGIVLPDDRVRYFATWFYKLKCNLLDFEIKQSGIHPARWEKKGSALLTTRNFNKYPQVQNAMNRILNKVEAMGGFVFYVGLEKYKSPGASKSEELYAVVLREAIRRLNKESTKNNTDFMIVLDESDTKFHRDVIVKKAAFAMFGQDYCDRLIEPPFQVCSHLYQTLQCADWLCTLIGRLSGYRAEPLALAEFAWAEKYFAARLKRVERRSSVRSKEQGAQIRAQYSLLKHAAQTEVSEVRVTQIAFEGVEVGDAQL